MEGKKPKDLKNKSFDSIQKMFDKAFKRVNTFVDFRTDLVEEAAKIKELMEIVSNKEEVAIDAIPLVVKPPSIVGWKIHKEGKKTYYQIIRADGSSKMYLVFSHMLKSFDREDLETLWKLVMFEPHIEDTVWRNQQDYRVLEWKLYDSDMDSELAHMVVASKVPMLKSGEYEIWSMRIEQYIQMIDYALWEVIENGNIAPKITVVEGVEKVMPPTTTEEKA
ncbi:hypothetical protein Tco_1493790 [Tanacetum coccineum]